MLSWTGGCGTGPAAQMTCPAGSNSVAARASNNGVAFSAEADLQVIVTSYAVNASPGSATVVAGQPATFVVTLSPQNGTFNTPITLGCSNLPAQASCTFNPPTVMLGTSPVQSILTISTASSSMTFLAERPPSAPRGLERRASIADDLWIAIAFATLLATQRIGRRAPPWLAVQAVVVLCVTAGIGPTRVVVPAFAAGMTPALPYSPMRFHSGRRRSARPARRRLSR
ncbi:MAG TPA: hypothetical protein VGJ29_06005 [Vicinamibacterales bacterium]|jgi:hypothetical protein